MDIFYLIGFVQSLFFVLILITKKHKNLSDYFLALFILLLGGNLIFVYSVINKIFTTYPILIVFDIYYWVLLGPILIIYTNLIISGKSKLSIKSIYLFIPALIITIGFFKYIFISPESFFSSDEQFSLLTQITSYIWFYNTPILFIYNIYLLKKHSKSYKKYFSYSKNVDLKWLYFLSAGFALFLISMHINPYLKTLLNINLPASFSYTWFVMVVYIFGIGFYGYKQKGVFSDFDEIILEQPVFVKAESAISYQKSGLAESEANDLLQKLDELMIKDKLYLNSEIDLKYLAEIINTSTHKLSQVINEKLGKNFFDYINGFRVKEAKEKLINPDFDNLTILGIAYESGFNSKSAFYNMFKKSYHTTPTEYRRKEKLAKNIN